RSQDDTQMLEPRLILVNLLIKLGVAAALSSALVRSKEFKNLIFREQRTTRRVLRRVGRHAVECICRNCCGVVAPVCARTGRYLVVLAVYRSHTLSHDSAQSAATARVRLAGCFFRDHRRLAFSADRNLALLAELHLQSGKPGAVVAERTRNSIRLFGGVLDLPERGHGGGHGTENLQQRPHPDQARRAGTIAAAGAHG